MFYEGFWSFSLRRGLAIWLPLVVVMGLGLALVAVSRDLGDEFSFTSPEDAWWGRSQSLRVTQVAQVLQARLPSEYRQLAPELALHIVRICRKLDFEPAFALALMETESGFRPDVVSPAGAIGLMQLMPMTAAPLARKLKVSYAAYGGIRPALRNPFFNVRLGLHYMSQLRRRYAGMSPYWWMAAYNLGPTRLDTLRARGADFKPIVTVTYYRKLRRRLSYFRHLNLARRGTDGGRPGRV